MLVNGQTSDTLTIEPLAEKDWCVDNLGNIYLYNDNEIIKYSFVPVHQKFIYSNLNYGDINKIDVTNPLKTLVFHKDQNVLEFLDNTLSNEQNTNIPLTDIGLYNVQNFCYSKINNGIWFYDKSLFQLIKINTQFQPILQTGNLIELLNLENKDSLIIKQLTEYEDKLYVSTTKNTFVFDMYGAYLTTLFLPYKGQLTIENNKIYSYNNRTIYIYDLLDFENYIFELKATDTQSARIKNQHIYIKEGNKIIIQKLELSSLREKK